jgi:tetratricopeptide (TPR) repeat protein
METLSLFPMRARVLALVAPPREAAASADAWVALGLDLEARSAAQARYAYHRALALEPAHTRALVNLGRLAHEAGDPRGAAALYRRALAAAPADGLAAFNLGVALEDLGKPRAARAAYGRALALDPEAPDALWNLAQLEERQGFRARALGHLLAYRRLARRPDGRPARERATPASLVPARREMTLVSKPATICGASPSAGVAPSEGPREADPRPLGA